MAKNTTMSHNTLKIGLLLVTTPIAAINARIVKNQNRICVIPISLFLFLFFVHGLLPWLFKFKSFELDYSLFLLYYSFLMLIPMSLWMSSPATTCFSKTFRIFFRMRN